MNVQLACFLAWVMLHTVHVQILRYLRTYLFKLIWNFEFVDWLIGQPIKQSVWFTACLTDWLIFWQKCGVWWLMLVNWSMARLADYWLVNINNVTRSPEQSTLYLVRGLSRRSEAGRQERLADILATTASGPIQTWVVDSSVSVQDIFLIFTVKVYKIWSLKWIQYHYKLSSYYLILISYIILNTTNLIFFKHNFCIKPYCTQRTQRGPRT